MVADLSGHISSLINLRDCLDVVIDHFEGSGKRLAVLFWSVFFATIPFILFVSFATRLSANFCFATLLAYLRHVGEIFLALGTT